MLGLSFPGLGSLRIQEQGHRAALHLCSALEEEVPLEHLENAVEDRLPELGVGQLAATETDRHLDLVPLAEELPHVPGLEIQVVVIDLRLHPDLLDPDLLLMFPRLSGLLLQVELVLPVVEQLADGGLCLRSD